ncbi:MAG: Gfo/Idh/MocA family oxidoreductase, partial [Rhodospirillaceae bacterium]
MAFVADALLGVVGAGTFARTVLLPRLAKTDGVVLKTLVTKRGISADHSQETFGFQEAATDEAAVFDDPEINAVLVATPHSTHAD